MADIHAAVAGWDTHHSFRFSDDSIRVVYMYTLYTVSLFWIPNRRNGQTVETVETIPHSENDSKPNPKNPKNYVQNYIFVLFSRMQLLNFHASNSVKYDW